ncbi:hypothetical protein BV20DRAFT_966835 [Pilatotrama ljubarskyi]|nr:hypothetical protein BV20DRAFT_966835 [Pilatotrama ljubarskyi]
MSFTQAFVHGSVRDSRDDPEMGGCSLASPHVVGADLQSRSTSPELLASPPLSTADIDDADIGWSQGNTPPRLYAVLYGDDEGHNPNTAALNSDWTVEQEVHLHQVLAGPLYTCGHPPSRSPLLARFAPDFNPWHYAPIMSRTTGEEEDAISAFRQACIAAAEHARSDITRPTASEHEYHGLFGLLALCTLALAKSTAARDLVSRRQGVSDLRMLVDAMEVLADVEEEVLRDVSST